VDCVNYDQGDQMKGGEMARACTHEVVIRNDYKIREDTTW